MKKILLVITKGEVGGAQMSVINLAKGLANKNFPVCVSFGEGDFLKKELEKNDLPYHRFEHLKRTNNPFKNIMFAWELKNFLKKNHYDVVHFNSSNTLLGSIAVKLFNKKIKTVFTFRGLSILDENCQINPIVKKIYYAYFKICSRFLDEKVFVSRANLIYAQKIKLIKQGEMIYNGLNPKQLDFLDKNEARLKLTQITKTSLEDKFIIGSIGRLAYAKNFEFLISVFDEVIKTKTKAILIVVGDGPEKEKYLDLVKEKKLSEKIFFIGTMEHASKLIKGFDLFVLPSRYEGLSITLIEALMAGAPILASDVGGNMEMLKDENQIFKLNDKDDFMEKFKQLSQDEKKLQSSSQNNIEAAKIFNIENTVNNYLKIYIRGCRRIPDLAKK